MNVAVLGEARGSNLDEGVKNFGVHLTEGLEDAGHRVRFVDVRNVYRPGAVRDLARFDPDVVHLLAGPTAKGLALLRGLSLLTGAATVATATQPRISAATWPLVRSFAPDRMLVQSSAVAERFETHGIETELLPAGVDLSRFAPVSCDEKRCLRQDRGVPPDDRVFLHVGHLNEDRNVGDLASLTDHGTVLLLSSPATDPNPELGQDLRAAGCDVRIDYVPDIERYYQISDVYVFPARDGTGSIQIPLSVLEAMACNAAVVTTPFGGLPDLFETGDGLRFVERLDSVSRDALDFDAVATRTKVAPYSWGRVAERVLATYREVTAIARA